MGEKISRKEKFEENHGNEEWRVKKAAIKREESQAHLNYPEREQARPKVNEEWRVTSDEWRMDKNSASFA